MTQPTTTTTTSTEPDRAGWLTNTEHARHDATDGRGLPREPEPERGTLAAWIAAGLAQGEPEPIADIVTAWQAHPAQWSHAADAAARADRVGRAYRASLFAAAWHARGVRYDIVCRADAARDAARMRNDERHAQADAMRADTVVCPACGRRVWEWLADGDNYCPPCNGLA